MQLTHREDLIPLLVPAVGRRAVQRTARRAESAEVTIHNAVSYTHLIAPPESHALTPLA